MATQCLDISPLIQMYLDGELTDRDLHDFEHHVASCDRCADNLEEETAFHEQLREQLTAAPASDFLRSRIGKALDREDAAKTRLTRRVQWSWALPGASLAAAAAALIFFVTNAIPTTTPAAPDRKLAEMQVQRQKFAPATAPLLRQPMTPTPVLELPRVADSLVVDARSIARAARDYTGIPCELPQFRNVDATLRGFQPTELSGRPAALLNYDIRVAGRSYRVALFVVNAHRLDLRTRETVTVGNHVLSLLEHSDGHERRAIAYRTSRNIGYVFVSDMDEDALIDVVANSGLLRD